VIFQTTPGRLSLQMQGGFIQPLQNGRDFCTSEPIDTREAHSRLSRFAWAMAQGGTGGEDQEWSLISSYDPSGLAFWSGLSLRAHAANAEMAMRRLALRAWAIGGLLNEECDPAKLVLGPLLRVERPSELVATVAADILQHVPSTRAREERPLEYAEGVVSALKRGTAKTGKGWTSFELTRGSRRKPQPCIAFGRAHESLTTAANGQRLRVGGTLEDLAYPGSKFIVRWVGEPRAAPASTL